MKLFDPANRHRSDRHAEVWAIYELAHTLVDFTAAGMFVVIAFPYHVLMMGWFKRARTLADLEVPFGISCLH